MVLRGKTFVGRDGELTDLMDVAAKATAGEPWLALVEGEPGMGKTALTLHFTRQLDRFTVLTSTADRRESTYPGAVLGQLLRRVEPAQRKRLGLLVKEFEAEAPDVIGERLISLFAELDETQPVVLAVDDAHWMDDFSLLALLYALRRLWRERVMVLLTLPSCGGKAAELQLRSFLRSYERSVHLRLAGLDGPQINELAQSITNQQINDDRTVDKLSEWTGGRPLYLARLLSDLPVERLTRDTGSLTCPSLTSVVQAELAGLPAEAKMLVEALAVLDAPASLCDAARVAGLDQVAASETLEPLLGSGMITWRPHEMATAIAVRHTVQRDAIYALMSPVQRQGLHAAAATVVGGEAVWSHRVAARAGAPDRALANKLELVATEEHAAGRHASAAAYMRSSADLSQSLVARSRRLALTVQYLRSAPPAGAEARKAIEVCRWMLADGHLSSDQVSGISSVLAAATLVTAGPGAALEAIAETTDGANDFHSADCTLLAVRGSIRMLGGQLTRGLGDLTTALPHAIEGVPMARWAPMFMGWGQFLAGHWDELPQAARPGDPLSRIWLLAGRGFHQEAQKQVELICGTAGEHVFRSVGRAIVAQVNDDHAAMYQAVIGLRDPTSPSFERNLLARWWMPLLIEAEIGTGRLNDALETLSRLGDVHHVPYLRLQVARLRALIAQQVEDSAEALAILEQEAGSPATSEDAPFYRGRLLLSYGRLLRAAGKRRQAVEHLQAAFAIFTNLAATPFVGHCTDELARCGLHVPRQRTRYGNQLTGREREIASIAASGKTNQEIAAELYVTTKTVEYHLAKIFMKLNISSRRQLAAFLRPG